MFELIKIGIALFIVLGALYLMSRFLRHKTLFQNNMIEILQYHHLGPKKGIAIVRVLKEYLVLGVAEQSVSLLSRLAAPDVEEALEQHGSRAEGHRYRTKIKDLFKWKFFYIFTIPPIAYCLLPDMSFAAPPPPAPQAGGILGLTTPLEMLLFLTLLSLLPAILVMTTCFTRIVVVLSFLRQALGTPQVPPNTVIIGLALFVTLFVMSPVIDRIYADAYMPYTKKEINAETAFERAAMPLKEFMLRQTREKDLAFFLRLAKAQRPAKPMDLSMKIVIPAFAVGELKKAFEIGFLIYLPFLVIDMVVASVLLSMGMMMLPPVMVSMPFKLLLFVLVDGWELLIGSLVGGFK